MSPRPSAARRALLIHESTRDKCVGREIDWSEHQDEAIDQEWYSEIEERTMTFSGFAYEFISFDLVLDGWLQRPPQLTDSERGFMDCAPKLRVMTAECEMAAKDDGNSRILKLIPVVRDWIDALENAVLCRAEMDGINTADDSK